jgi:hypothetical protein
MQTLPVLASRLVVFHRDAVGLRPRIVGDAGDLPRDLEDASIFGSHLTTAENGRKIGSESFWKCEKTRWMAAVSTLPRAFDGTGAQGYRCKVLWKT